MEEIVVMTGPFRGSIEEMTDRITTSLGKQKEEFVRTGWLLRSVKDTKEYEKQGYKDIWEYALKVHDLKMSVASRYMSINEKYSEGGYSEYLKEEYRGFGVAKLGDMIELSDVVIESLDTQLPRREIQQICREVKEEKRITDLEVMMESTPAERPEFDTLAEDALYQYMKENKAEFKRIFAVMEKGGTYEEITEKLLDIIAPSGIAAKTTRIPGKGKIMISVRGIDENVDFLNVRNNEKESRDWRMIAVYLNGMLSEVESAVSAETAYEELYGEPFNAPEEKLELLEEIKEKPEVAPVQQTENKNIVTTETENKDIVMEAAEETDIEPATESMEPELKTEVEKVTGEVVEKTSDLEEIKEKLAIAFIKRYETRLEESENMKYEVFAILDKVHKSEWLIECGGEEYFVVEMAGHIKLRQREETIVEFYWPDFYQLMHKVYWKGAENYTPPINKKPESCTSATEEQLPGQKAIEDYPEYLPEGIKSNMEIWQEIREEVKVRVESIAKAVAEDNYTLIKWDAQKLAELMEEIR